MFRSGNPALRGNIFTQKDASVSSEPMTIQGTVNKTLLLLAITFLSASWVWGNPKMLGLVIPAALIGFIIALITIFKKEWAHISAPAYALVEGVFLGGISSMFEAQYPGIVIRAVALTFGTLFCLLMAYRSGLIKPTENFKLGIVAATGAIALVYFVSIILSFFGIRLSMIFGGGPVGILFSLVVVTIAALNLVLDFDFIEKGAEVGAPRYLEWYAAFSLIVTLVWLYLEILRLLAKLQFQHILMYLQMHLIC